MLPVVLSANGQAGGYRIANSLRFRSSASAYLSRTPSTASNRTTWTWSGWVKRGQLGDLEANIFGSRVSLQYTQISFRNNGSPYPNQFYIQSRVGASEEVTLITSQVFRDPSSWYHIVVAFDTTQATSTNRVKLYVNGSQVTSFAVATYPAQNYAGMVNYNQIHAIAEDATGGSYFDGYLADINFIDGQALTPSSFGEFNPTTGVWQPKQYSGTYGTNGFKLNFSNGTSTTTLGYDSSGNGNNWTTNNISLTAGATYDWMIDSPTPYQGSSYGVGNYSVINPVSTLNGPTIQSGNLEFVGVNTSSYRIATGTIGSSSGKWYWEATINTAPGTGENASVGITSKSYAGAITNSYLGNQATEWGLLLDSGPSNYFKSHSTLTSYSTAVSNGDVVQIAYDIDAGKIWFGRNGTWFASGDPASGANAAYTDLVAGTTYYPAVDMLVASPKTFFVNFGQRSFSYTPPTGYKSLCTYNLPTPTIQNGAGYMAATTFTATGTTQSISNAVNSVSFQPNLVWTKARNQASSNYLNDSVRGASKWLSSNQTIAETTDATFITSFNSDGFSLGTGNYPNGITVVGWQWKAGGTAVTNTAGSITSSVSANTTSGFSVVTWTGNGSGTATVGHGLGVAPAMVITKSRSAVNNWWVAHSGIPTSWIQLDTTGAAGTGGGAGGAINYQSTFTSSVFGFIAGSSNTNNVNANGSTYVAYCFAAIAGYSAFGSYTGNGSSDGPFVYCGFRPRYVLCKTATGVNDWQIYDSSRDTYNLTNHPLYPDLSNAEGTDNGMDLLSNGFKLRGGSVNASGQIYIYAAFAENPFQNALAR